MILNSMQDIFGCLWCMIDNFNAFLELMRSMEGVFQIKLCVKFLIWTNVNNLITRWFLKGDINFGDFHNFTNISRHDNKTNTCGYPSEPNSN